MGCVSSPPPTPDPEPNTPTPVEPIEPAPTGNVTSCVHKYDNSRDFRYSKPATSYTKEMFGETVKIYFITTLSGEELHVTSNEIVNYICTIQ